MHSKKQAAFFTAFVLLAASFEKSLPERFANVQQFEPQRAKDFIFTRRIQRNASGTSTGILVFYGKLLGHESVLETIETWF